MIDLNWKAFVPGLRANQAKLRTAFLTASACLFLLASASGALASDRTYVNPRFGTTITFNAAIFTTMDPPSENGDGARWRAPDGAELAVWGQNNVLDFTPESLADFVSKDIAEVTYRKVGARWMVLSGFASGKIVYHRAEFGARGVIHSMEMRYPSDLRKHYDLLASRIAESLIGP